MNSSAYNPSNPFQVFTAEVKKQSGGIFSRISYALRLYWRDWRIQGRAFKVLPVEMTLVKLAQLALLAVIGAIFGAIFGTSWLKAALYAWLSVQLADFIMALINPEFTETVLDAKEQSVSWAEYAKRRQQASSK